MKFGHCHRRKCGATILYGRHIETKKWYCQPCTQKDPKVIMTEADVMYDPSEEDGSVFVVPITRDAYVFLLENYRFTNIRSYMSCTFRFPADLWVTAKFYLEKLGYTVKSYEDE